jgi:two-component system, sensor histidine kinase
MRPGALPPPLRSPPPARDTATPAARPRRILLVEDGEDARKVMHRLLSLWGHEVEVAANGLEGVRKALEFRPDVALVDLGLPALDGFQVARQIRAKLDRGICLVALTGYGQPEDRQRTRAAGFDHHLVKPVEPIVLRKLLDQPDPRQSLPTPRQ